MYKQQPTIPSLLSSPLPPPHHVPAHPQARIEDLVKANLQARLDILPPEELALALHEFVEKDERSALAACVTAVLTETQAAAVCWAHAAGLSRGLRVRKGA